MRLHGASETRIELRAPMTDERANYIALEFTVSPLESYPCIAPPLSNCGERIRLRSLGLRSVRTGDWSAQDQPDTLKAFWD
jgi:hypothetical protein